jgi:hypothetical protein
MSYGRSSGTKSVSNGFGLHLIGKHARSLAWRLDHEGERQRASSGPHFQVSTANAPCVIRTFGTPIKQCYLPSVIVRSGKTAAKPIISSGSTILYGNAVVGWCAERSPFRKRWRIISAQSGISSMTIMHDNARNSASLLLHDYRMIQFLKGCGTTAYRTRGDRVVSAVRIVSPIRSGGNPLRPSCTKYPLKRRKISAYSVRS